VPIVLLSFLHRTSVYIGIVENLTSRRCRNISCVLVIFVPEGLASAPSSTIGHDAAGRDTEGGRGEKRFQGGLANVSCRWLAGVNAKTEITNS